MFERVRSIRRASVPEVVVRRYTRWASRLSGFALATALTGLVGFATIPSLIAITGAATWSVVAFGQAVGVLGAVLIGWGWTLSGSSEAALADPGDADDLLVRSIAIRSLLVLPVGAFGAVVALLLAPQQPVLAATSAVAYSLAGMSAAWFYTGVRAPRSLILREVLPRTVGIVAGLLVCAATRSAYPFPVLLAAGCVVGVVLNLHGAGAGLRDLRRAASDPLVELRHQFPAVASTLVSTVYISAPTVLVGVLAPGGLVVFALADRLYRTANMAASPVLNVLQGAIPSRDPEEFRRRVRVGLTGLTVLGVVAGTVYALGAPLIAPLLTEGRHALPLTVSVPFGLTLLASYLSQVVALSILVTLGRVRSVAISSVVAALAGLPILLAGTAVLGATGAAIGVAVAEGALTLTQLRSMRAGLRLLGTGTAVSGRAVPAPIAPLPVPAEVAR